MNNKIKEAFDKIKEEMDFLNKDISEIRFQISKITEYLNKDYKDNNKLLKKIDEINNKIDQINPKKPELCAGKGFDTSSTHLRHFDTYSHLKQGDKPYLAISTGNKGVSTDRQTLRQTTDTPIFPISQEDETLSQHSEFKIFDLISNIKKNLKDKFKGLTQQEMLIFSKIYILTEKNESTNYRELSIETGLTESSIRDYVSRLENKGIPIIKEKINNKLIKIRISDDLKEITTLDSISKIKE